MDVLRRVHHRALYLAGPLYSAVARRGARFSISGKRFPLDHGRYNFAWSNERAVELAIARTVVREFRGRRILEVGNVLSHYGRVSHEVVDKFERGPGVRNVDVVDLDAGERYDLVVSVSTLEHVGFDERPRVGGKFALALRKVFSLVAEGGTALVTLPIGYNPEVDAFLRTDSRAFEHGFFLTRVSGRNDWEERGPEIVEGARYGARFPGASELFVGIRGRLPEALGPT